MREINRSVGASLCCPVCSDYSKSLLLYCLGLFSLHWFFFCKLAKMFMCKHKGCILLVYCSSFNAHLFLIGVLLNFCGLVVRERKRIICLLLREEGNDFPNILKALIDVGNLWWLGRCPRPLCEIVSLGQGR